MFAILNIFITFISLNINIGNNVFTSYSPKANVILSSSDIDIKPFVEGDDCFMKKFYVYLHLTPKGIPFYVGKGCAYRATIKDRRSPFWKRVVKKNKGFKIHYLAWGLSEEEALLLEEYYIALYGKRYNNTGYLVNFTDGGTLMTHGKHSKVVCQFDLDGNFIKKYLCVADAAKEMKCSNSSDIHAVLNSNHQTAKGFLWATTPTIDYKYIGRLKPSSKKVFVYDLDGNFIKEFPSISECGRQLNINPCQIVSVLKNKKRRKTKAYRFSYHKEKKLPPLRPRVKGRKYYVTLIDNETGNEMIFSSPLDVAKILGISKYKIYDSLRGKRKSPFITNNLKIEKTKW